MRELMQRLNHSSAMERIDAALVRIWRRRWLAIGIAWLICVLGWLLIAGWPDRYRSSAVVFADTDQMKTISSLGAGDAGDEPTAILRASLLADRYLQVLDAAVGPTPAASQPERTDVTISTATPPIFVISYEHDDPLVAQRGLNALLTEFIDLNFTPSSDAAALDHQIEQQRARRDAAASALEDYRRVNAGNLGGPDGPAARLEAARAELLSLAGELEAALAAQASFEAQLADLSPTVAPAGAGEAAPPADDPRARLAELQAELAKLRERYAETHPYIVQIKEQITGAEAAAAAAPPPAEPPRIANPDYEQNKDQLVKQASLIGSLRQQITDKEAELALLETAAKSAPTVEAKLAELMSERDRLEGELAKLITQRRKLSEEQADHRETSFRMINAPSLPTGPTGPPRLFLLGLVLLAGAGLGGVVAVMRSRMDGVFETTRELRRRLNVAVIGSLSAVVRDVDRRQQRVADVGFGLACLALIGLCSSLMMAESWNMLTPIGDLLRARLIG